MDFDAAFVRLIGHEKGYANHPDDPGGETCWGVTARVARAYGYTGPMRELPLAKAKEIAKLAYWNEVRADDVPAEVRFDLFDTCYHSGPVQATKFLQRGLRVTADGVLGPKTLAAVRAFPNGFQLLCRFNGARLDFLNDLPNWKSFHRGWSQRIAENLLAV